MKYLFHPELYVNTAFILLLGININKKNLHHNAGFLAINFILQVTLLTEEQTSELKMVFHRNNIIR